MLMKREKDQGRRYSLMESILQVLSIVLSRESVPIPGTAYMARPGGFRGKS